MKKYLFYRLFLIASTLFVLISSCRNSSQENKITDAKEIHKIEHSNIQRNDSCQIILTNGHDSLRSFKSFIGQKCYETLTCNKLIEYYDGMLKNSLLESLVFKDSEGIIPSRPNLHSKHFRNHNYLIDLYNYLLIRAPNANTGLEPALQRKLIFSIKKVIECKIGEKIPDKIQINNYYYLVGDSILHQKISNIDVLLEGEIIPLPLDFIIDPGDSFFDKKYLITRTFKIPKDYYFNLEVRKINNKLYQFLIANEYKNSSEWTRFYDNNAGAFIGVDEVISRYMKKDYVYTLYDSIFNNKLSEERITLEEFTMKADTNRMEEYDVYRIALSKLDDCIPVIASSELYIGDSITTFTAQCGLSNHLYDFYIQAPMKNEDIFKE